MKEFNFGDKINLKFAAQYADNIMPSLNSINLFINYPPLCSKLFITRQSELALTNINVATTCDPSNDSPYKYQLKLFLREQDLQNFLQGSQDNFLILFPFQNSNQFSIQIPSSVDSSVIGVLIQVLDQGGSITNIYEKINSKPAKIDCSQIQYQNLNLQNKIVLLFEAMNLKCNELHNQIYIDLLLQQILPDQNQNILKFQAIKLYKQFLISLSSNQVQNRLLNEDSQNCYDANSSHFFLTKSSNQTNYTKKIQDLKENIKKLDIVFKYLSQIKKECEQELNQNSYSWNEEIFQTYQNSLDGLRTLLYYLDQIYSDISIVNSQDETIYQNIVELLKYIPLIVEEIQNTIFVNEQPLVIQGKEIIWQIKRRTKQLFNLQFNIKPTEEDYLVDFVQFESTYLQTNPFRFSLEINLALQQYFNDPTLQIFQENYYQIQLKNIYNRRFLNLEDFSSSYGLKFGSYQYCQNNSQILNKYEMLCIIRTISGKYYSCNLNIQQSNETIEIACECNKFGDVFLVTSTNFSKTIVKNSTEDINSFDVMDIPETFLVFGMFTIFLTFIFLIIYLCYLFKDCKEQQERFDYEETTKHSPNALVKNSIIYPGNFVIFRQKFKQIHQSISLFYYKDKQVQLSYRILELFSQLNLYLALVILECNLLNNQTFFIIGFIIANPLIILIFRVFFKVIEAIYRFRKIAAFFSQIFLLLFMIVPILILFISYLYKSYFKSELYVPAIIFVGNIVISQALIEPLTILVRIIIYRLIATSIQNIELNPKFHFLQFFVYHSSLEEIFEEFIKM